MAAAGDGDVPLRKATLTGKDWPASPGPTWAEAFWTATDWLPTYRRFTNVLLKDMLLPAPFGA